jgi:phosphatidate cytidylyltransferase
LPAARELQAPGGGEVTPSPNREIGRRVLSSLVLAVGALAAAVFGDLPFLLFWTGAAFWIWWEWTGIIGTSPRIVIFAVGGVAITGMAVALGFDAPAIAFIATVIGVGVVAATATPRRAWAAGGMIYAAAVLIPCVMLRSDPALGLAAILWLFAVVWAADIAAYFSGRHFGGPRLAATISPNKTWSGTLGGALGGVMAGTVTVLAFGLPWRVMHLAIALVVVIAAQIGDLFESAMKRRFGVKDASRLIPGHGGLMDRLDGFLAAATVALAIGLSRAGANAATGLLAW